MWYLIFLIVVAAAFYLVNWKVKWDPTETCVNLPIVGCITFPRLLVDIFLAIVFVMGILQWIGIGR